MHMHSGRGIELEGEMDKQGALDRMPEKARSAFQKAAETKDSGNRTRPLSNLTASTSELGLMR